jgi:2-dehydropantoate 2-reductase
MGAGSIGCYVGGRLIAAAAAGVTLIGRQRVVDEVAANGLTVSDMKGKTTVPPAEVNFSTEPEALEDCDAVLVSVKSAATDATAETLAGVVGPDVLVLSLQNGVRNAATLRKHLGKRRVAAGVVDFNVVSQGAGVFHCGLGGPLSIERLDLPIATTLVTAMRAAGFVVREHDDIAPVQWTKLLVNANNAVSALSDVPTRELLADRGYRRIAAAIIAEGVAVLHKAAIEPAPMRGLPVSMMPRILRLPDTLARMILRSQLAADAAARSSMWEDLTRGRPTEVDYLNGEIVALAEQTGGDAPLNRRIVELVHAAESAGRGSPAISAHRLWQQLSV